LQAHATIAIAIPGSAKLERGPAGHILTGPIFVEGAESCDALEVRVLSAELALPYGYQA
jgi:acetamidase/formamidase